MFQVIVALSATLILSGGAQQVERSLDEPLQGNFPTFASLTECHEGLLKYANPINAAAGHRLTTFTQDNAKELGTTAVRRDKYKIRCGRNVLDQTDVD